VAQEGVGVSIDAGTIRAVVVREDLEIGEATASTGLGRGTITQRLRRGLDLVARRVDDLAGDSSERPWLLVVSSQSGSAARSIVRDAAHAAGVHDLSVVSASSLMAERCAARATTAVTAWWGSDGLDVGVVHRGRLIGHGGGAELSTDAPLQLLGALTVGDASSHDELRAAGVWAASRSRAGDLRADGFEIPSWDTVASLWQGATGAAVDLFDEAVGAAAPTERPLVAHLDGDVGPIEALADRLSTTGRWRVSVERRSLASSAAALAVRRRLPVRRCGLDLGVESDSRDGAGLTRIIERNSLLPVHRELVLGALDPALSVQRVLVHEMWGGQLATSRPVVDLEVRAAGADRFRLVVDVDTDGVVSASCGALG
jgi:hypothetical protein